MTWVTRYSQVRSELIRLYVPLLRSQIGRQTITALFSRLRRPRPPQKKNGGALPPPEKHHITLRFDCCRNDSGACLTIRGFDITFQVQPPLVTGRAATTEHRLGAHPTMMIPGRSVSR